ncbi:hypothetical protein XELAEV_18010053mg [Xenopus laevis]|uniref:Uncharacterized protein n=1 Tax=Xenopus laevis TaxID=8355 RepID=A0A974DVK3_XENLA|nr:hypothetical protein XELAEV_18010053mg [Xenopus laevis]
MSRQDEATGETRVGTQGALFGYTDAEVTEIMAGFTGPTEFLHTSNVSYMRKQFESLQKWQVDLELHGLTLAEYHRKQWIPHGLRVSLSPTLFANNEDYCMRFAHIINKCSADIMVLTLEFIKKSLNKYRLISNTLRNRYKSTAHWMSLLPLRNKWE